MEKSGKKEKRELKLTSLHHLLAIGATEYGQNDLFLFERAGVDYTVTYSAFYEYVKAIARGLIHYGWNGKRVALIGETSVEWLGTYLATVISGGEVVPLDAALNKDQLINFVNLAECDLFFYSDSWATHIEENADAMPTVACFARLVNETFAPTATGMAEPSRFMRLSDLCAAGNACPSIAIPDTDTEKMCSLLFTSGTTGSSKGVMLSQKNICAALSDAYAILDVKQDDALLSVLPIHHTYEMTCGIMGPMMYGASIAINDSLKHITKNLKKYRPTIMTLVPLFLEQFDKKIKASIERQGKAKAFESGVRMSRALLKVKIDLRAKLFAQVREAFGGRLRVLVCGGAALNPALVDSFRDLGIQVSQGYGITECAPLIAAVPFDVYNPKSCGKVLDHLQVFIDKANADDEFGEIVVKGGNVMLGYYKNPEATQEVISKGWFYTGDYGYMDQNGYLYITGRKKNVIVLPGGKNVFPEEVEEYLASVELIEECVVLGRETDGDVIVTAIVYPNQTCAESLGLKTQEEVCDRIREEIRLVNRRLVNYKQVRKVEFRNEPFEKTTTRKIKRFTVK